jgi:hypothetical protein
MDMTEGKSAFESRRSGSRRSIWHTLSKTFAKFNGSGVFVCRERRAAIAEDENQ